MTDVTLSSGLVVLIAVLIALRYHLIFAPKKQAPAPRPLGQLETGDTYRLALLSTEQAKGRALGARV